MGQPRIIERKINLAATGDPSGNDVLRCWDAPDSESFKNLRIVVSSRGTVLPANNLDWEVFYGGFWTDGNPYESGSIHNDGVSQASASIAGGTAIHSEIHTDAGPFLPNRTTPHPSGDASLDKGRSGRPIVVELTNNKTSAIIVYVTFQSETVIDFR